MSAIMIQKSKKIIVMKALIAVMIISNFTIVMVIVVMWHPI